PTVHPMDAFGANPQYASAYEGSQLLQSYAALRASLKPGDSAVYAAAAAPSIGAPFANFLETSVNSLKTGVTAVTPLASFTRDLSNAWYSIELLALVKVWEVNQEFQLEGMPQAIYGPRAELRAWAGN